MDLSIKSIFNTVAGQLQKIHPGLAPLLAGIGTWLGTKNGMLTAGAVLTTYFGQQASVSGQKTKTALEAFQSGNPADVIEHIGKFSHASADNVRAQLVALKEKGVDITTVNNDNLSSLVEENQVSDNDLKDARLKIARGQGIEDIPSKGQIAMDYGLIDMSEADLALVTKASTAITDFTKYGESLTPEQVKDALSSLKEASSGLAQNHPMMAEYIGHMADHFNPDKPWYTKIANLIGNNAPAPAMT